MSAPVGLGWWVAFEGAAHPGGKTEDLAVLLERCQRSGASWIALRGGDGSANDPYTNAESIRYFRDAGLNVFVWIFSRPGSAYEVPGYKKFLDWGVDGAIINAEFPSMKEPNESAKSLVENIRAQGYDFVAHAPPDYAGSSNLPPWNGFDLACDAIMPQVYAWEHDDRGHEHHLDQVRLRYLSKNVVPIEKVWPILCSYRPKVRGFDSQGKSRRTPTIANEASVVAEDLIKGLEHPWVKDSVAPSIYSLDAITSINGADDRVMAALESWHSNQFAAKENSPLTPREGEWLLDQEAKRIVRDP